MLSDCLIKVNISFGRFQLALRCSMIKVQIERTCNVLKLRGLIISSSREAAGIVRAAADKFNWFLVRVPLIITGPLGKKKRAMIFARFSTPGTFPRKLRGEFRAPFSAAGCSRFSALYLNARRISRAGRNALLKSAIFYPIFPSYFFALRFPSLSGMRPGETSSLLRELF